MIHWSTQLRECTASWLLWSWWRDKDEGEKDDDDKDIDIYVAAEITMHLAFSPEPQTLKPKRPSNPGKPFLSRPSRPAEVRDPASNITKNGGVACDNQAPCSESVRA